jgi:hypothetical protein
MVTPAPPEMAAEMAADARPAKDGDLIGYATEIKLRAERRAGELLAEMPKAEGSRSQLKGDVPVGVSAPKPPTANTPTLSDLGITKTQSSRWQASARMPEAQFEAKVAVAKKQAVSSVEATAAERAADHARGASMPTGQPASIHPAADVEEGGQFAPGGHAIDQAKRLRDAQVGRPERGEGLALEL